ncbi:hypothetical protein NH14_007070 [Paraburkholderia sacchari]|uniref:Uncharacterized protein n=2 Tax=Paraburkholderia sacchari TaxID=159450 RepID=A0A8T6Z884_9BURK|nr:hypothetical protein [Paraburkholderia sacchari]
MRKGLPRTTHAMARLRGQKRKPSIIGTTLYVAFDADQERQPEQRRKQD